MRRYEPHATAKHSEKWRGGVESGGPLPAGYSPEPGTRGIFSLMTVYQDDIHGEIQHLQEDRSEIPSGVGIIWIGLPVLVFSAGYAHRDHCLI